MEQIFEVRYTDTSTGKEVTELRTTDKQAAINLREELISKKFKSPHIQYSFANGGLIGYRPEFLNNPILTGKQRAIKFPNGEVHDAKYAIVELESILASHNEKTYSSTINYPVDKNGSNVNDRNYTGDSAAQAKIIDFAQNLDEERLISLGSTPSGTPIISIDGIVVSGNNRTMSMKLAKSDYPKKFANYIDFLIEELSAFGFKKVEIIHSNSGDPKKYVIQSELTGETKTFTSPVLVRIDYSFEAYNSLEYSKYNKDSKKSERPIDKALKLGKILASSDRCTAIISNVVGRYETFTEFYSNSNDIKIVKNSLIDCDILTTQETPAYFTSSSFTEQGKELIENLLAGLVLNEDALVASESGGARKYRQTIITSLPVLTANKALPEFNLNAEINEAIIIQNNISSSNLTFQDLITQTNIGGTTFTIKGMYMNRLLDSGRNTFKKAIEAYNSSVVENQGESLFGDKPTEDELFSAHISSKVSENDQRTIQKVESFNSPSLFKNPNIDSDSVSQTPNQKTTNLFVNGNYFKSNPDNVLATISEGKNWRTNEPIKLYKGDLSDVKRIQVDISALSARKSQKPLMTVVDEKAIAATDVNTSVINNFESALNESSTEIPKKKARKRRAEAKKTNVPDEELLDTYTAREVWDMLNPEVSIDELRAFIWWKNSIGRPITGESWFEIAGMSAAELYNNHMLVDQYVKDQLLYYFEGELIPAFLYLSENVYDKKLALEKAGANSGHDRSFILERYGDQVYQNQIKALQVVYKKQYDKRLMIGTDGVSKSEALIISPISSFSQEFKIKSLADGSPFLWKKITQASNKRYGTPDYLVSYVATKDKVEFEELSLRDAFAYWLRTDSTIQFQKGTTYADIIRVYLFSGNAPATMAVKDGNGNYVGDQLRIKKTEEASWERVKSKSKTEGDRLFLIFLSKQLLPIDQTTIEMKWNREFNGYVPINLNKVPVIFRCNKYDMGKAMIIKPEKRDAVAFSFIEGSGLLAYDVGVGKTPSAIFTICQFLEAGYAQRPLLVVPNQTYKQWISEFGKFASHIRINELYNLDAGYIEDWQDVNGVTKQVESESVSIITYEGMIKLGFTEETIESLKPEIGLILIQESRPESSDKKQERDQLLLDSKIEKMIGTHLAKTSISIEELGFDFISFDEAHALKKVFTNVIGEAEENLGNSGKSTQRTVRYKISSGVPASRAIKGFLLSQYIQTRYNGNTLMLSATPITNSPLEIFSMLALVGYNKLKKMGLENLNVFFDTFIETSYEMIINAKLRPERRQVILGFNNLIALQSLLRRFMNYKTGEEVNVPRPNKYVLPYKSKMINGVLEYLPDDQIVDTVLPLSDVQAQYMIGIKQYANGEVTEDVMCSDALIDDDEDGDLTSEGAEFDEEFLSEDEKAGVRMLKAMNHARNLALSPYIFSCSRLGTPTAEKYIHTSNKLHYVMQCIKTIKDYHESEKTAMSGVVIYMNRGVKYFPLIRQYLIEKLGFEPHEVGIISSQIIVPVPSKVAKDDQKEYVKNLFLGKRFNTASLEMENLSDKERCKVIIGSGTIKEGINLQTYSSTLFNCWLDWNPTDLQQLEGRIYRQGNKFNSVRIVNPLMMDSMDIFMFQKIEEKTSRINTLWATEGRLNVLKTEEFNPRDLKYSLIEDPRILAEMELLELAEKLDEDIADAESKIKRNEKILGFDKSIRSLIPYLDQILVSLRPMPADKPERSNDEKIRLMQDILRKQLDENGKKMAYSYEYDKVKEAEGYYSPKPPLKKPFFFDELNYANRGIILETRNYLVPNGVTIESLPEFSKRIEVEIDNLKAAKLEVASDEAITIRSNAIQAERISKNIVPRTVDERVQEFKRLNYLLSDTKPSQEITVVNMDCPPVDANGEVRIDPAGLELLEKCLLQQPDTKLLHTNESGEYSEQRLALHDKIIQELIGNAICITQGQPIAILTGGSPSSGKSTFLNKYAPFLKSDKIWKIDADEIRAKLPEYQGWNASTTHQETRDILNQLLTSFDQPCKHDLLYDGTMSNSKKYIPLIRRLKAMGYLVFIAYMEIPKAIAIERSMNRYKNNRGGKLKYGRYVPLAVINDFFHTGKEGLNEIKNSVDGYVVVDSLTQEITESGGRPLPKDRDYYKIFDNPESDKNNEQSSSTSEKTVLETRLKLLKRREQTATVKTRIKLIERMLQKFKSGGLIGEDNNTVITKDGVKVEKNSNKYKGHIFFDETGGKYECQGYYPKLDDCVYIDLQTNNKVVGCMDGFYFNDPTNKS